MASLKGLLDSGVQVRHLSIGEYLITQEPMLVSTVLGSCVSVTFFHPGTSLAAIFHAMLPFQTGSPPPRKNELGKFVETAIPAIIEVYKTAGVRLGQVETKLFGGAFTIYPERKGAVRDIVDVGAKNVESAKRLLKQFGMNASKENILGASGRKILFYTGTGDVWLKYLNGEREGLEAAQKTQAQSGQEARIKA
jgi:chemotaxis protein CheD